MPKPKNCMQGGNGDKVIRKYKAEVSNSSSKGLVLYNFKMNTPESHN